MFNPPALPRVDIVIPVYNEEKVVAGFHRQLCQAIDRLPYALPFFTLTMVRPIKPGASGRHGRRRWRVEVFELSRNFGHQAALTAGLDQADAEYVITMDSDGQQPAGNAVPDARPGPFRLRRGADPAHRRRRYLRFKRWTSTQFYSLLNRISATRVTPARPTSACWPARWSKPAFHA